MVRKTPTHRAVHRNGWDANIYIADSLLLQLNSRDTAKRDRARTSVCIRFRKACQEKFPNCGLVRVEWHELTIRPLAGTPTSANSSAPASAASTKAAEARPATPAPKTVERHCCDNDNCQSCDMSYHERCQFGCTL